MAKILGPSLINSVPFYRFSVMVRVYVNTVKCHAGVHIVFLGVVMHLGVSMRGCGYVFVCMCAKQLHCNLWCTTFFCPKVRLGKGKVTHLLMSLAWCINYYIRCRYSHCWAHVCSYVYLLAFYENLNYWWPCICFISCSKNLTNVPKNRTFGAFAKESVFSCTLTSIYWP